MAVLSAAALPDIFQTYPEIARIVAFILTLFFTWLISKFVGELLLRSFRATMFRFTRTIYRYAQLVIWFFGIIYAIGQLGLSINLILVIIGLGGLGFVLTTRRAFENMFSRFFIDLISPYKVGDFIKIGDIEGEIVEVNSLNTILSNKRNEMVSIPNSLFLKRIVINTSPLAGQEIYIPITIDQKIDEIELEKRAIKACYEFKKYLVKSKPPAITTIGSDKKLKELSLILTVKNPEKRSYVLSSLKEKIKYLISDLARERLEEEKARSKIYKKR